MQVVALLHRMLHESCGMVSWVLLFNVQTCIQHAVHRFTPKAGKLEAQRQAVSLGTLDELQTHHCHCNIVTA